MREELTFKKVAKKKIKIKKVFDGSVLVSDGMIKHLPYILFLVFLAIVYIGNRFSAEYVIRKTCKLQEEIKELNSESIATASELMNSSKQSVVLRESNKRGLGLKESTIPPTKVTVEGGDFSDYE